MRTHTSIFNLIEIFTKTPRKILNTISPASHCEHKSIHDYYCDSEQPFVSAKNK